MKKSEEFKYTLRFELEGNAEVNTNGSVYLTPRGYSRVRETARGGANDILIALSEQDETKLISKEIYIAFASKYSETLFEIFKNSIDAYLEKSVSDLTLPVEVIFIATQSGENTVVNIIDNGSGIKEKTGLDLKDSYKTTLPTHARLGGGNRGVKQSRAQLIQDGGSMKLENRASSDGVVVTISVPTAVLEKYSQQTKIDMGEVEEVAEIAEPYAVESPALDVEITLPISSLRIGSKTLDEAVEEDKSEDEDEEEGEESFSKISTKNVFGLSLTLGGTEESDEPLTIPLGISTESAGKISPLAALSLLSSPKASVSPEISQSVAVISEASVPPVFKI